MPPHDPEDRPPHHGRKGPPHHGRKGPPQHHGRKGPPHESGRWSHMPSSAVTRFIDRERIEALLAPWVPDEHDRAFVVRCMLGEGPAHHRGANYVLLALLGRLLERLGPPPSPPPGEGVPVPLRLPPHLEDELGRDDDAYPLRLATRPLERLAPAGSREHEAMIDCLIDGPPQHALANAAMVALLDALLERAPEPSSERAGA
jgi:hypothetical protein